MALNRREKICLVVISFFFSLGLLLVCTSHESVAIYPFAVTAAAWIVMLRERVEHRISWWRTKR